MHRHTIPLRGRLVGVAAAAPGVATTPVPQVPVDTTGLQNMLAALGRIVDDIQTHRQRMIADVAPLTAELAVAMAERLLKTEIAANRQRLDRIVQHALERVSATDAVTLRAHPEDAALLERQLVDNADLERQRAALTVQADETLPRGHLKFEAAEWFVEWDTTRCLAELRNALLEETW